MERENPLPAQRRGMGQRAASSSPAASSTGISISLLEFANTDVVASAGLSTTRACAPVPPWTRRAEARSGTGWVPADPVVGEWISVDFPDRELAAFSLTPE